MEISEAFEKAAKEQDKETVRQTLLATIRDDPTGEDYRFLYDYAHLFIKDLYDAHDGENLRKKKDGWTQAYYEEQEQKARRNYSKQRLQRILEMSRILYPERLEEALKRGRHRQDARVRESNEKVGQTFMLIGFGLLVYGLISLHQIAIILGSVGISSGFVIKRSKESGKRRKKKEK